MKSFIVLFIAAILLAATFTAIAETGPSPVISVSATTTRTFVLVQNHLSSTTKKVAYVLAEDGELEVAAWRWDATGSSWDRVLPNPAEFADISSDSVMICPSGFVLPVVGQFDALTLRAVAGTVESEVQVYR